MSDLPASQFIEPHGDGYRIAGTRISLDSIAHAVRRGATVDDILADFPALESRRKLEGAVAFIQSHRREVGAVLDGTMSPAGCAESEPARSGREGPQIP